MKSLATRGFSCCRKYFKNCTIPCYTQLLSALGLSCSRLAPRGGLPSSGLLSSEPLLPIQPSTPCGKVVRNPLNTVNQISRSLEIISQIYISIHFNSQDAYTIISEPIDTDTSCPPRLDKSPQWFYSFVIFIDTCGYLKPLRVWIIFLFLHCPVSETLSSTSPFPVQSQASDCTKSEINWGKNSAT